MLLFQFLVFSCSIDPTLKDVVFRGIGRGNQKTKHGLCNVVLVVGELIMSHLRELIQTGIILIRSGRGWAGEEEEDGRGRARMGGAGRGGEWAEQVQFVVRASTACSVVGLSSNQPSS